ncbi:hypothetical protein DU508_00195 [Pedobacter chinensis]|uniref:DUF3352 domain-containing protein n=1 Tax=Pedobacter chinensis TaxID=2282421 RepID=A0A369Q1T5_9SPHI|nr:DUF3352 domain-containing protein [Pedobacter chinensis]RDC58462.1 hypothetical protein DU508_00195 [Pedobacter chinensis]
MKKIIILLGALFIGVAFMAYLYFSKLGMENNAKDLALQSATNNAALVFSFQNDKSFYEIIEAQDLIQQVLGKEKINFLKQLREVLINDNALNSYIKDQHIYISVLPDSNKTLNFLLTVEVQPDEDLNKFNALIKSKKYISEIKKDIYRLKLNDTLSTFARIQDRVITLSTSIKLINDAAIRLNENPFSEYIKENNGLNKNVLAHIYINFNQAPLLLRNILASNINGGISCLNKQNSFAALNYNFSKEKILFNGSTTLKNNDNYLKLFESSIAQNTTIQNILPDNTANYVIYAYDDYESWFKKFSSLQESTKELERAKTVINTIKNEYRTDLNSIFPLQTKNQFTIFQLSTAEKLGAIQLVNGEKVKQLLFDVSADYNEEIKLFKSSNILQSYFGEPFKNFSRPYYTIIDNFLVVANNASTVQSFLNSYRNNKLLIQTPEYLDALNQISNTSNISYYINLKKSQDIFRSNVLLKYYKHLRADSGLRNFDTFLYQMISDKNKFITNLLLNKYLKSEIPDSLGNR